MDNYLSWTKILKTHKQYTGKSNSVIYIKNNTPWFNWVEFISGIQGWSSENQLMLSIIIKV